MSECRSTRLMFDANGHQHLRHLLTYSHKLYRSTQFETALCSGNFLLLLFLTRLPAPPRSAPTNTRTDCYLLILTSLRGTKTKTPIWLLLTLYIHVIFPHYYYILSENERVTLWVQICSFFFSIFFSCRPFLSFAI